MAKTFVLVGHVDICGELAPNLLEAGFKAADGVASADVVFTYTPFIEDTEEVYFGSEGMIATAGAGTILVNLAPVSPSLQHEIYAIAQVSDMTAFDAPLYVHDVSREHAFADRGNLSMFVGANGDEVDELKDMLDALSANVVHCGSQGSGQLAKAASSLRRAAHIVSLVEADALCRIASNDDAAAASASLQNALAVSSVDMETASLYAALSSRRFAGSYSADVLLGEVVAALSAGDDYNLMLPQGESAEYLLQLLLTIGGSGKAATALSLLYSDEGECAHYGLDWSRAEDFYGDGYDDYGDSYGDGYDDYDDDYGFGGDQGYGQGFGPGRSGGHGPGRGEGHGNGHGFGFGPYSSN